MKNFDTDRDLRLEADRQFQIGGTVFTCKPAVAPEALIRWADMGPDTPEAEAIDIIDTTVLAFLEPGQEDEWRKVRDVDASHPLTVKDILGVIHWLVEDETGRPTTPPSDSSGGPGTPAIATNSTAESASLVGAGYPDSV